MRLMLKILVAPVIVVLTVFVWICSAFLYFSAWVFGLAGTVLGIFGMLALITHQVTNGIILLVMAFSRQSVRNSDGGGVAARQDTGFAVRDSGPGLQLKRSLKYLSINIARNRYAVVFSAGLTLSFR